MSGLWGVRREVRWRLEKETVSYGRGRRGGGVERYVPPERGRAGVEVARDLDGREVQSAAATAGTGVAAESWRRARRVKARPRMKARNEGIVKDTVFWMVSW